MGQPARKKGPSACWITRGLRDQRTGRSIFRQALGVGRRSLTNATTGSERVVPDQQPPAGERKPLQARLIRPVVAHWQFGLVVVAAIVGAHRRGPRLSAHLVVQRLLQLPVRRGDAHPGPGPAERLPVLPASSCSRCTATTRSGCSRRRWGSPSAWPSTRCCAIAGCPGGARRCPRCRCCSTPTSCTWSTWSPPTRCSSSWSPSRWSSCAGVTGPRSGPWPSPGCSSGTRRWCGRSASRCWSWPWSAMLARRVGWRRLLTLAVTGIVPIGAYMVWFHGTYGQYALTDSSGSFLYSRVSTFAQCSKMNVPPLAGVPVRPDQAEVPPGRGGVHLGGQRS